MSHPAAVWQRSPEGAAGPREGTRRILMACLQLLAPHPASLPCFYLEEGVGRLEKGLPT